MWRFPVCPCYRSTWESWNLNLRGIRCGFRAPDWRGLAGNTHESSLTKHTFTLGGQLSSLATWAFRHETVFQRTSNYSRLMRAQCTRTYLQIQLSIAEVSTKLISISFSGKPLLVTWNKTEKTDAAWKATQMICTTTTNLKKEKILLARVRTPQTTVMTRGSSF